MYQYNERDAELVLERIREFRHQIGRRLKGELTEEQFKPLRLLNGLYDQIHGYMLRVAIPYGTLTSEQMKKLAGIAGVYDEGYGHFTTRQNIQFNWIKLVEIPSVLEELAAVNMHSIQTSGNVIRNVTTDQFAGVAKDEIADPRPYAEIIRQWSTFHPEFSFLGRKFKIAVIASETDRAAMRFHDIGLKLKKNSQGKLGFEVVVGGGMGRTPFIGHVIRDFLPEQYLLSYLEAILRVYNEQGRRDNIYKARIKILVHEMKPENFRKKVEEDWQQIKDSAPKLSPGKVKLIRDMFSPPAYEILTGENAEVQEPLSEKEDYSLWLRSNIQPHKVPGYAAITLSLKPIGGIPGDASARQMLFVADLAERVSFGEIRVAHEQNLVLPYVKKSKLFNIWSELQGNGLGTPNVGLVSDIIACPGMDYCKLANARSIPVAQKIATLFGDLKKQHEIGELKINISGCINACGHHHAGHIGILGVDRKGEEFYQLLLGGDGAETATIGKITGPGFSSEEIVGAVETVINTYLEKRKGTEPFLQTYRRLGPDPFKEALYAH